MFKFSHQSKELEISVDGCFEPNLTTKIMLSAAIKELTQRSSEIEGIVELGCGSGVISAYLLAFGYYKEVSQIGMSDLSPKAVEVSKENIRKCGELLASRHFDFRSGSGLTIWNDINYNLIINDISAISDAILPMNSWFANAPNNAGIDGIDNSVKVLQEFVDTNRTDIAMLMPVLSLSNTSLLIETLRNLGLQYSEASKQSWPLPKEMVEDHGARLLELRELGHINFVEKFGQYVVETACYKVWKG